MRTKTHFRFLSGDYGGKWYQRVGSGRYHIIELINWVDAVGAHEAEFIGATYNVSLSEVDLLAAPDSNIDDALSSWSWTREDLKEYPDPALVLAEVLYSYGNYAPLWQEDGNNYRKLLKAAKAESLSLDDGDAYEAAMNRPVNAIGSTAREYAQGDIYSAITRGVRKGDDKAKLLAKSYGASDENIAKVEEAAPAPQVFSMNVKLNDVPSDDPIAFQFGYMTALAGGGLDQGTDREDLAPAYIEGYKLGVDVKTGNKPQPAFHQ